MERGGEIDRSAANERERYYGSIEEEKGGGAAKKESTDIEDIGIDPKGRRKTKGDNDGGRFPIINRNGRNTFPTPYSYSFVDRSFVRSFVLFPDDNWSDHAIIERHLALNGRLAFIV